jgi:hypothetical protein
MIGFLLVLLGFNTAALFIFTSLAAVFYGTPAQQAFSTLGAFSLFLELVLPFVAIGSYFFRPTPRRSPGRAPRYQAEPVGEYKGLDEATRRYVLESLEKHAAAYRYLRDAETKEKLAELDRRLVLARTRQIEHNVVRARHPYATDAAAIASDWANVGQDMLLETARSAAYFKGDEVQIRPDGTYYMPRLKLHIEADGTTWKEIE